jgi:tetratricopeptide (TPR) repeat protein
MRPRHTTCSGLRAVIALLGVHALSATLAGAQSLSFADGAALARERAATHLVFVHGSDWNLYGERLMQEVWRTKLVCDLADEAALVLSDVDALQSANDTKRAANELRNTGWKGTGLTTYPAFIAFDSQGRLLGSRQGLDLPRNALQARICVLEFMACLRFRAELDERLAEVRATGDAGRELELLLSRDGLDLEPAPDLLERLRAIDTDDARRLAARIEFPDWFGLVRQATSEAAGGEGAQTEERLRAMLEEPAYTDDQRATVWFALGSAYRRWEGHAEQAGRAFRAAWKAHPDGLTGTAGRRMYLNLYAGPSLAFGWVERHAGEEGKPWIIEDLPPTLAPGTWRLKCIPTAGDAPPIVGARLFGGEEVIVSAAAADDGAQFLFVVDTLLRKPTLHIDRKGENPSRSKGKFEWAKTH